MKNYSLKFLVVMAVVGSICATSSNVNARFGRNNLSRAQVDRLIRNV